MIADTARVTLEDGCGLPAMEVYPGREILSFTGRRMTKAKVLDRRVASVTDAAGLILSTGQKLVGSRDQPVAVFRDRRISFIPLADVKIGDHLRGERAGIQTVVDVIGLMFYPRKEVRLVGFRMNGKSFVAEGIQCR